MTGNITRRNESAATGFVLAPNPVELPKALAYEEHIHHCYNRNQQANLCRRGHAQLFNLKAVGFQVLEQTLCIPPNPVTVGDLPMTPARLTDEEH